MENKEQAKTMPNNWMYEDVTFCSESVCPLSSECSRYQLHLKYKDEKYRTYFAPFEDGFPLTEVKRCSELGIPFRCPYFLNI